MNGGPPIECFWNGEAFVPSNEAWKRRAAKQYVVGEVYNMVDQEPRSLASHNHYFAAVETAWKNLPEILAERFPTADHLRKYALVKTGWYDSKSIVGSSHEGAMKLAAFIRPLDEFAVVDVKEAVVTVYTAKTQSFRMGNEDFKKSKDDVLGFLADLIGVSQAQLTATQGAA
jgi:uncharacterized protein (DUF2252 family)